MIVLIETDTLMTVLLMFVKFNEAQLVALAMIYEQTKENEKNHL